MCIQNLCWSCSTLHHFSPQFWQLLGTEGSCSEHPHIRAAQLGPAPAIPTAFLAFALMGPAHHPEGVPTDTWGMSRPSLYPDFQGQQFLTSFHTSHRAFPRLPAGAVAVALPQPPRQQLCLGFFLGLPALGSTWLCSQFRASEKLLSMGVIMINYS